MALHVLGGDDSSDPALHWPEPRGLGRRCSEGPAKARPRSSWREPCRCACWTVGFCAAFDQGVGCDGVPGAREGEVGSEPRFHLVLSPRNGSSTFCLHNVAECHPCDRLWGTHLPIRTRWPDSVNHYVKHGSGNFYQLEVLINNEKASPP